MRLRAISLPLADDLNAVVAAVLSRSLWEVPTGGTSTAPQGVDSEEVVYQKAASLLGLIRHSPGGFALTDFGERLARASAAQRPQIVANAVLSLRIVQRLVLFLEAKCTNGCSAEDVAGFLLEVTDVGSRVKARRAAKVLLAWLLSIEMISERDGCCYLAGLPPGVPFLEFSSDDEPLLPSRFVLAEYETVAGRTASAEHSTRLERRRARRERSA